MDYEALLRKYIGHVDESEGVTFLDERHMNPVLFTPEEQVELLRLASHPEGESDS